MGHTPTPENIYIQQTKETEKVPVLTENIEKLLLPEHSLRLFTFKTVRLKT